MMEAVYIDLYIHPSGNPDLADSDYDIDTLVEKIEETSGNSLHLISIADRNVINKAAYLGAMGRARNLLPGVGLNVCGDRDAAPCRCHAFFNGDPFDPGFIDGINARLESLYPKDAAYHESLAAPSLEAIIKEFEPYDFFMLFNFASDAHIPGSIRVFEKQARENIIRPMLPSPADLKKIEYGKNAKYDHVEALEEIDHLLRASPFITYDKSHERMLRQSIEHIYEIANFEKLIRWAVDEQKEAMDALPTSGGIPFDGMDSREKVATIFDMLRGCEGDIESLTVDYPAVGRVLNYVNGDIVGAIKKAVEGRQAVLVKVIKGN